MLLLRPSLPALLLLWSQPPSEQLLLPLVCAELPSAVLLAYKHTKFSFLQNVVDLDIHT